MAAKKPEPPKAAAPTPKAPTYNPGDWRDPASTFAPDDKSLDAELWRMAQRTPNVK